MLFYETRYRQEALEVLHKDETEKDELHNGWFNYSIAALCLLTIILVQCVR